jgi:hypothetical protein
MRGNDQPEAMGADGELLVPTAPGEGESAAVDAAAVSPAPLPAVTATRPLSEAQLTEVVRDVVRQLAPEELAVFDTVADSWLSDDHWRHRSRRSPGAAVGFGVETVLLTELAFPIVSAAIGEVLGNVVTDRAQARRRASRRATAAEVKPAGTDPRKISERADRDVLTGQQAEDMHEACRRHATTLGMSPAKAKLLADAVLGSLNSAPGRK